jgi:hypothetical protein
MGRLDVRQKLCRRLVPIRRVAGFPQARISVLIIYPRSAQYASGEPNPRPEPKPAPDRPNSPFDLRNPIPAITNLFSPRSSTHTFALAPGKATVTFLITSEAERSGSTVLGLVKKSR